MIRRSRLVLHGSSSHASSAAAAKELDAAIAKMKGVEKFRALSRKYGHMAWEGMRHLYHGFRLFGTNTRLAWRYSRKLKEGVALSRRERVLLERATVDLLRLVPFSFFIIVPGAELLLPITLKMFPGIIPSTFETDEQGVNKAFTQAMATMKARKRMIEYMTTTVVATSSSKYTDVLQRMSTGDRISEEHIRAVSQMCRKDGPLGLYNLPFDVLCALAQAVGVYKAWFVVLPRQVAVKRLRSDILSHYWKLKQDDQVIRNEGITTLTHDELQKACQARGMRWVDNEEALVQQLEWWISLSTDPKIPYNTLFWLKPTANSLRRSMEALPVEQRRKLLGIMHLPPHVQEQMENLCEKVEKHQEKELVEEVNADALAAMAEEIDDEERRVERLGKSNIAVQKAIGEYLCTDERLLKLYDEILVAEGRVTNANVIDYLASDIKLSSHLVSTVFDDLEMGPGKKPMTIAKLRSLAAHCRESAATAASEASKSGGSGGAKSA